MTIKAKNVKRLTVERDNVPDVRTLNVNNLLQESTFYLIT